MARPDEVLLELRGISKSFPGVHALDAVDLDVRRGEIHVLLGANGAGKSTLTKIVTGIYQPDSGVVLFKGQPVTFANPGEAQNAGISVIYQERTLIPHLTVAENVYLGDEPHTLPGLIDHRRMIEGTQALLDRLNLALDPKARAAELEPAEQQMVEVARALHRSADLIVMDEPTAVLSAREVADLFRVVRALRAAGVAVLYISHRLEEVLRIGDRATVLRDGRRIATVPLADTSLDELIRLIVGRHLPPPLARAAEAPGHEVLRVEGLQRTGVLGDISFTLHAGEILGVTGLIGAGGTALMRTIFGADRADAGTLYIDGAPATIDSPQAAIARGIGLLTEDRHAQGLVLDMSAENNMTLAALASAWPGPLIDRAVEDEMVQRYAARLGIRPAELPQPAVFLSGGAQQKVVLSKWLAASARVLLFDEPTRGIDVGARVEIYRMIDDLARRGTGILIVSVDLTEVLALCDRILVLRHGRIVADLPREQASQQAILTYASGGMPA